MVVNLLLTDIIIILTSMVAIILDIFVTRENIEKIFEVICNISLAVLPIIAILCVWFA